MKHIYFILYTLILSGILNACVEEPDMPGGYKNAKVPEVTTCELKDLIKTAESVDIKGEVKSENGAPVSDYGFCWGTQSPVNMTNKLGQQSAGKGKGAFSTIIKDLTINTNYYIRAYAINEVGVSYGDERSFNTTNGLGALETVKPYNRKASSALSGGKIIETGEGDISSFGVYVSSSPNAQTRDTMYCKDKIADVLSKDSIFTCQLIGLEKSTIYYATAFVTNKYGTITGVPEMFVTTNGTPTVSALENTHKDFTYADFRANVTDEGDTPVTKRGFCYSESDIPTIEDDTVVCGHGSGVFTGSLKKLKEHTQYFVRAYAQNSYGVSYNSTNGYPITLKNALPTINTNPVSTDDMNSGVVRVGGEVLDEGESAVISSGICWSTNSMATLQNGNVLPLSAGQNAFKGTITDLQGGITYYVRAYATNDNGTNYGKEVSFTTPSIFVTMAVFPGANRIPGSAAACAIKERRTGYILGGDTGPSYTDEFWSFDAMNNRWQQLCAYPLKRKWQTAVGTEAAIIVFGGLDELNKATDDFYYYSVYSNAWAKVGSKGTGPAPMYYASAAYDKSVAYFIGGRRDTISSEVWSFTTLNETWEKRSPLPEKQYGGVSAAINNVIYSGFGLNSTNGAYATSKKLWSSADEGKSWKAETTMPGKNVQGGVAYKDYIYVVDEDGYIYRYNTATKKWNTKSQLPLANRMIHCMYELGDLIYIGLGSSSSTFMSYNPSWDN